LRQTLFNHEYDVATSAKDRINTIYLGQVDLPYQFDWRAAAKEIEMAPGCVAVEMEVPYTQFGNLVVSQVTAGRLRSDCGTVLSVGKARSDRSPWEQPGLQIFPGDRVACLPYDGKHFSGFLWNSYASCRRVNKLEGRVEQSRVRMFGVASKYPEERFYKDWWEVIVSKIQTKEIEIGSIVTLDFGGAGYWPMYEGRSAVVSEITDSHYTLTFLLPEGDTAEFVVLKHEAPGLIKLMPVQPVNKWVLIRRRSLRTTASNIHLPDTQAYREQVAQVVAIGPRCENGYRVGDWVVYHGKALVVDFEFGERFGFIGDPRDYCLIHEEGLHARVRPPEAE
jgi:co-chaperonin GroES (HSP10)